MLCVCPPSRRCALAWQEAWGTCEDWEGLLLQAAPYPDPWEPLLLLLLLLSCCC